MDKYLQLRDALIAWRIAERTHARAVLAACHPVHLRNLDNAQRNALRKVREIVDSSPWVEIALDELDGETVGPSDRQTVQPPNRTTV
jgi:hypothetical protein